MIRVAEMVSRFHVSLVQIKHSKKKVKKIRLFMKKYTQAILPHNLTVADRPVLACTIAFLGTEHILFKTY